MGMYNFLQDLERFRQYAAKVHNCDSSWFDIYANLTGFVEKAGHRAVAKKNKLNRVILEIGVGGGEHIPYEVLFASQKQYYAIDLDFDFAKIAKKHYSVKVISADGACLPFKENIFDSCIAISVLEHTSELEKLLLEVKAVVKKEGDFFVVIPTNGSLCINIFKLLISYPAMYIRGIKKPSYVWNYLNVHNFKRIICLLTKYFSIKEISPLPFKYVPVSLSPLCFVHCKAR